MATSVRTIYQFASIAASAAALLTLAAPPANAAKILSCAAEIDLLAHQYGLAAQLPKAGPPPSDKEAPSSQSQNITPDDLKRSQGVIAPEADPPARVISPDKDIDPQMPKAEAQNEAQNEAGRDAAARDRLDAAKRTQMQGLVDAARQEHQRGNEKECLERIAQARAIPEPG
jgi:hypothetical protein